MVELIQGDCLELMKDIPDSSCDLIVTDPPYGINFQSHRRRIEYEKIKNDTNLDWLDGFFRECGRVLKKNTAIYCFCSWHNIDVFKQAIEKHFKLKNIIVWVKNNHGSGDLKASYAPKYEFILYANKGRRTLCEKRYPDVLFANKTNNVYHPTEKPVDLLEQFIKNSVEESGIVLDPFMGSGSTGVACVNAGRNFIGIELDKQYFDIAVQRIERSEQN